MERDYVHGKLIGIAALPTFPDIMGEMARIIEDPESSASDLARHMDPAMVGEVLKAANNACAGTDGFKGMASLEQAIAVIGFERLLQIVLHMPFLSMTVGENALFDENRFISHSIVCGALSKEISSGLGLGNPGEVYLSGVMHDVGIIIIYRYFRKEWDAILGLASASGIPRVEAERSLLSCDHGHVGADLLDMWKTPKSITDGVRFHHEPEAATENRENVLVTYLANMLAKEVDLKEDLANFDDFVARHRASIDRATDFGPKLSATEEITFLARIYGILKEAKGCVDGITGEKR